MCDSISQNKFLKMKFALIYIV